MKKFIIFVLTALLICTGVSTAFANDGYYLGVNTVVVLPSDITVGDYTATRHTGYSVGIVGGYTFSNISMGNDVRLESEISYKTATTDKIKYASQSEDYDSTLSALSLMGNVYYDVKTKSLGGIVPYVGAGIGAVRLTTNSGNVSGVKTVTAGHDVVFAYQLAAGIAYRINPVIVLDLGYRYLDAANGTFHAVSGNDLTVKYAEHSMLAGLRYNF